MSNPYVELGADRWLPILALSSSGNALRVAKTGANGPVGAVTVGVSPGDYVHATSVPVAFANGVAGYFLAPLLGRLEAAIQSAIGVDVEIRPVPSQDAHHPHTLWLELRGSEPWQILWQAPQTTLDPRLLGWPAGHATAALSGAGDVLRPPHAAWPTWVPSSPWGGRASYKNVDYRLDVRRASADRHARRVVMARERVRSWSYPSVYAASVHAGKVGDELRAAAAQLPHGEPHAHFETLFEHLALGGDAVCVHDVGTLAGLDVPDDRWELVGLPTGATWSAISQVASRDARDPLDVYDLAFELAILAGTYGG